MPLETPINYINDLNPSNPAGTDGQVQGDDHLRGIKAALKGSFPNFAGGAVTASETQFNSLLSQLLGTTVYTAPRGTVFLPAYSYLGDTDTGIYSPGANQVACAVGGSQAWIANADGSVTFNGNISVAGGVTVTGSTSGPGSVPIGGTVMWWSDTLPSDGAWAWCNGGTLSRSTYSTLFALLGTAFGAGNGTSTFNVPDMREAVPVGKSTMGGASARGTISNFTSTVLNAIGGLFGEAVHLLTTGEMPSHSHTATVTDPGHTHTAFPVVVNNTGSSALLSSGALGITTVTTSSATTGISVANSNTGSGTTHNNVQPSVVCNYIIRIV